MRMNNIFIFIVLLVVTAFSQNAEVLIADEQGTLYVASAYSGVYYTSDLGKTWEHTVNNNIINEYFYAFAFDTAGNLYAGGYGHYMYKLTKGDSIWQIVPGTTGDIFTIFLDEKGNIFRGHSDIPIGIFKSTDDGNTWAMKTIHATQEIVQAQNKLFAATYGNGIIFSEDEGESWQQSNLAGKYLECLYYSTEKNLLITAAYNGIIYRTDLSDMNWEESILNDSSKIFSITEHNSNLYTAGASGVHYSNDNGKTWISFNEGLPENYFWDIYFDGENLFAGSGNKGVYYLDTLSNSWISMNLVVTSTDEIINADLNYSLSQNYPNPFNPSTKIKFSVPAASPVTLKVYDMLGREIAVLINKELLPGSYEVDFNGVGLSSGVYFYRLEAGEFVSTQKMILLR